MKKQIIFILMMLMVIAVGIVYLLMTSPMLEGKTYFCKRFEKTDDGALYSGFYGNVISFKDGNIVIIEVKLKEDIIKEIEEKTGGASVLDMSNIQKVKVDTNVYEKTYFDRSRHKITAKGLEEPIQMINSKEIRYKGQIYYLTKDYSKISYLAEREKQVEGELNQKR